MSVTFLRLGTPGGGWVVLGLFSERPRRGAHRTPAADATAFRGSHVGQQPTVARRRRPGGGCVRHGRRHAGESLELVEWGGYSGYVADPDGHLWEIARNRTRPSGRRRRSDPPTSIASDDVSSSPRRYVVHTYGCQMNEHDSERIAGLLDADGMEAVDSDADADVVVLNVLHP
ncbi:MAG: hypothetical protein R2713_00920 [Ilumatobacteraceae bacterium]